MKNTPITENHLYQKAYAKGKSAPGRFVAVYTLPDRQNHRYVKADPCHRPLNRIGLTTGKKIGGSVVRSRARRLMREAYRLIESEYGVCYGNLIVIAARARIAGAGMEEVKLDLLNCMRKLGLVSKPHNTVDVQ